jgi:hypothetical protein
MDENKAGGAENPERANGASQLPVQIASVNPMEQLVGVERLIEIVWSPEARPCAKWVRQQTRIGAIPCVERGNRVWYIPKRVIEALSGPDRNSLLAPRRRGRPPGAKNKPKTPS